MRHGPRRRRETPLALVEECIQAEFASSTVGLESAGFQDGLKAPSSTLLGCFVRAILMKDEKWLCRVQISHPRVERSDERV